MIQPAPDRQQALLESYAQKLSVNYVAVGEAEVVVHQGAGVSGGRHAKWSRSGPLSPDRRWVTVAMESSPWAAMNFPGGGR